MLRHGLYYTVVYMCVFLFMWEELHVLFALEGRWCECLCTCPCESEQLLIINLIQAGERHMSVR